MGDFQDFFILLGFYGYFWTFIGNAFGRFSVIFGGFRKFLWDTFKFLDFRENLYSIGDFWRVFWDTFGLFKGDFPQSMENVGFSYILGGFFGRFGTYMDVQLLLHLTAKRRN